MSYYENRIKALEERVEEMAMRERIKAIPVEKKLIDRIVELKAEVERLTRKIEVADNHAQCLEMVINAGTANELRLKAEVERLKEGNDCLDKMHEKEMERSAWLREEFNRTTAWGRGLESDLSHARVEISFLKAEVKRLSAADSYLQDANEHAFEKRCDELEAEVERLRKAGDAMADQIYNEGKVQGICYASNIEAWRAAKEGKPSV
jgi:chromosome segregation ATPase